MAENNGKTLGNFLEDFDRKYGPVDFIVAGSFLTVVLAFFVGGILVDVALVMGAVSVVLLLFSLMSMSVKERELRRRKLNGEDSQA